jgi:hypothetical protein
MVKSRQIPTVLIPLIVLVLISCSDSSSESPKVRGWLSPKAGAAYYSKTDALRGNFYGAGSSLMPESIGRKGSRFAPGDYLDSPRFSTARSGNSTPGSLSIKKIRYYLAMMLPEDRNSDKIYRYIKDYNNVLGDTTRDEFFGRFIIGDQRFSLGGWYDHFAVIGLHISFKNPAEFISAAQKFFNIPQLYPERLVDSSEDSLLFYEYCDYSHGFRLRGFPIYISSHDYFSDGYSGTVIEYTRYDDLKFMHKKIPLKSVETAKLDSINKFMEWPVDLTFESHPFIDTMRDLYSNPDYSPTRFNRVRRNDRKIPGDYLFSPNFKGLYYREARPDSIAVIALKEYLRSMLKKQFYSDTLTSFITTYKGILKDSLRDEFFGLFLNNNQKMSFSGWYGKFAVMGLYVQFHDTESFSASAIEYFNLPKFDLTKIKVTRRGDRAFYEYIDPKLSIWLRGFNILLLDNDYLNNEWHTTVIEFTKYYDPEFVPLPN